MQQDSRAAALALVGLLRDVCVGVAGRQLGSCEWRLSAEH